jgi:hypothetical protein
MMPSVVLMNVELQHRLMQLSTLGKADGSPLQSFQVSAEAQVLAFDLLRPPLDVDVSARPCREATPSALRANKILRLSGPPFRL